MKLLKKKRRKNYYHTKECTTIQKMGREYYREVTDDEIERMDLELCGHCAGANENSNGDRSYYQMAKEIGESK